MTNLLTSPWETGLRPWYLARCHLIPENFTLQFLQFMAPLVFSCVVTLMCWDPPDHLVHLRQPSEEEEDEVDDQHLAAIDSAGFQLKHLYETILRTRKRLQSE